MRATLAQAAPPCMATEMLVLSLRSRTSALLKPAEAAPFFRAWLHACSGAQVPHASHGLLAIARGLQGPPRTSPDTFPTLQHVSRRAPTRPALPEKSGSGKRPSEKSSQTCIQNLSQSADFGKRRALKKNLFEAPISRVRARAGSPRWGRGDQSAGAGQALPACASAQPNLSVYNSCASSAKTLVCTCLRLSFLFFPRFGWAQL